MLVGHVRDTGVGIAKQDQTKLFSRFGKLLRTAEMNHEGIGLGLTIVKEIVTLCNGHIDALSKGQGYGCTFRFCMRMETPDKQRCRASLQDSSDISDTILEDGDLLDSDPWSFTPSKVNLIQGKTKTIKHFTALKHQTSVFE